MYNMHTDIPGRYPLVSTGRTGGDHQDALVLCGWRLSSRKSNNLSLNEAVDLPQNRPLWRLMSTFGAMKS